MSIAVTEKLMTAEEFLALPDDGTERMLLSGHLWEKAGVFRTPRCSRVEARISDLLGTWLDAVGRPIGEVYSGDVGCLLSSDSVVGIDVAYVDQSVVSRFSDETDLLEGSPILAVAKTFIVPVAGAALSSAHSTRVPRVSLVIVSGAAWSPGGNPSTDTTTEL